jgi:hypothetical protein
MNANGLFNERRFDDGAATMPGTSAARDVRSWHTSLRRRSTVTETTDAVIHEALSVIDKALSQMMSRELVSSGEITDVLLDVRTLLTMPALSAAAQH